jgi:hypothetical protein
MDFYQLFADLEASPIGTTMRESLFWLPVVNAIHIAAIVVVFGTIFLVDLRLIGIQGMTRPFTRVASDLLRFTWVAFALAAVTGFLLVSANATTFYVNTQFWIKMVLLMLAGINMFVFEVITVRKVSEWDTAATTPPAARIAGILSLTLWAGVVIFGRWIGYTKGWNFAAPDDLDLDNLFGVVTALMPHFA